MEHGHQYDRLLHEDSVRLLYLGTLPSPDTNCLEGELRTTRLSTLREENTDWNALSYAWDIPEELELVASVGGVPPLKTLRIGNGIVKIRQNLFDALVSLISAPDLINVVWADAVCINQSDAEEKDHQIQLMDKIFSTAGTVYAWLGFDTFGDSKLVRSALEDLSSMRDSMLEWPHRWDIDRIMLLQPDMLLDDLSYLERFGFPSWTKQTWLALARYYNFRWFSRLWCVQEYALGVQVGVVFRYGDHHEVDQHETRAGIVIRRTRLYEILEHLTRQCLGERQSEPGFSKYGSFPYVGVHFNAMDMVSFFVNLHNPESYWKDTIERLMGSDMLLSTSAAFFQIYKLTEQFQVSDPRDRIVATLGMLRRHCDVQGIPRFDIQARHSSSIADLYTSMFTRLLTETSSATLLCLCDDPNDECGYDLPSWVPNFNDSKTFSLLQAGFEEGQRIHDAVPISHVNTSKPLSVAGNRLELSGFRVGRIVQHCQKYILEKGIPDWLPLILSMPEIHWNGEARLEALWRSFVGDTVNGYLPAQDYWGKVFHEFLVRKAASVAQEMFLNHDGDVREKLAATVLALVLLIVEFSDDSADSVWRQIGVIVRSKIALQRKGNDTPAQRIEAASSERGQNSVPSSSNAEEPQGADEIPPEQACSDENTNDESDLPESTYTKVVGTKLAPFLLLTAEGDPESDWSGDDTDAMGENPTEIDMEDPGAQNHWWLTTAMKFFGHGYRLFRTAEEHLGLGPEHMQADDEVWIISKARVPFVLRRAPETFGQDRFRLIGECYVRGIMRGEALSGDGIPWETISLV